MGPVVVRYLFAKTGYIGRTPITIVSSALPYRWVGSMTPPDPGSEIFRPHIRMISSFRGDNADSGFLVITRFERTVT